MRDLPVEAPQELWPDHATTILAGAALVWAWKTAGLPGWPSFIRWFTPGAKQQQLGMFDEETRNVWLSTDLRGDELLRTIGHETEHARQYHRREGFSEGYAIAAGERFLGKWSQRTTDLHAAAEASGISRGPTQRLPFPGPDDDAPADHLAHLRVLEKRAAAARSAYSFDRGSA